MIQTQTLLKTLLKFTQVKQLFNDIKLPKRRADLHLHGGKKKCDSIKYCNEKRSLFMAKEQHLIKECTTCGHRFLENHEQEEHVREVYSDDYFFAGKNAGYPNYLDEEKILLKQGIKYARIVGKYRKPGKVLDIGCAAGFILKGFEESGWQCNGLEPNGTMANYGREQLHLSIETGSLENYQTIQTFDLINLIQVIGHFYDVDTALKKVESMLHADGLVLVESWNMKSTLAVLLGNKWPEYSPPSVVSWFSDDTLIQLFNYYGFVLVDKGHPSKRIHVKHALSLLDEKMPGFKFKREIMASLNKSFGKLVLAYPPFDLKWYIFRKDRREIQ